MPINDAQRLLGHSKPSTTLDLYTHYQQTLDPRVDGLFDAFSLPNDSDDKPDDDEDEIESAV